MSWAVENGPWGPYLSDGGSSDKATFARDLNGVSGLEELPQGKGRSWGIGSLPTPPPSLAFEAFPPTPSFNLSHFLCSQSSLSMSATYSLTYSLICSCIRYLWSPSYG